MKRYEVIVGNVGTVFTTDIERDARREFNEYVAISKRNIGRAGGEGVTLMDVFHQEIIKEYEGTNGHD